MNGEVVSLVQFTPRAVRTAATLDDLAQRFLQHLANRNYAHNTLLAYRHDLEQLAGFLAAQDVRFTAHVTVPHLNGFVDALIQGEGLAPRSAARKLETVRRFFAWCVAQGLAAHNPAANADPVRWQSSPPVAPDSAVLLRVIESIPADTRAGLRDRALFRLLYDGALRVSAALGLDVYDPARPPAATVHPSGVITYARKGGGSGTSVCGGRTLEWLAQWQRARCGWAGDDPALFISIRGTRLTRAAAHVALKKYAAVAGVPALHCHLFRHRRSYELIEAAGPHAAQLMLGHKHLSTTLNSYGAEAAEKLRHKVRTLAPLGGHDE